jgi:hypothetical protein
LNLFSLLCTPVPGPGMGALQPPNGKASREAQVKEIDGGRVREVTRIDFKPRRVVARHIGGGCRLRGYLNISDLVLQRLIACGRTQHDARHLSGGYPLARKTPPRSTPTGKPRPTPLWPASAVCLPTLCKPLQEFVKEPVKRFLQVQRFRN